MDAPKPLTVFRAYPVKGSYLYFKVYVFRTQRDLHRYGVSQGLTRVKGTNGYCLSFRSINTDTNRLLPHIGDIVLFRSRLSARVVSHECVHAMFGYFDRKKVKVPCRYSDPDERINASAKEEQACHIVSDLTNRIYTALYDRRIIK